MSSSENASSPSVLPGTLLGGRYRVEGEIGRGGMGRVIAAFDERLARPVAIKLLGAADAVASKGHHRFLREARAAAMLESEHVVRVHDAGVFEDAGAYLAMERLEGQDLQKALRERGRFSPDEAVEILVQACRAVAAAHESGIIHRDLKPSNLFLVHAPHASGGIRVKVLDFGISKITDGEETHDSLTETGSALGSPRYMSPEQVRDAKRVGPASDIWALGVIFYELLAGRAPFVADAAPGIFAQIVADAPRPLREQRSDVSAALEAICTRCLQKRPEDRYRNVTALARALVESASPSAAAESERDVGGTETTLDPVDPQRTHPAQPTSSRRRAASRRYLALGSLAAIAFAVVIPLLAQTPARRMLSPAVVERSARPLSRSGAGSVGPAASAPAPEPPVSIAAVVTPRITTAAAPSSTPMDVGEKTLATTKATTCDPPFVIDPATMTRRVKPGC